jgi:hypothetical protein
MGGIFRNKTIRADRAEYFRKEQSRMDTIEEAPRLEDIGRKIQGKTVIAKNSFASESPIGHSKLNAQNGLTEGGNWQ